jgi:predicted TIM-barrel fold metal-dependent hydrolase
LLLDDLRNIPLRDYAPVPAVRRPETPTHRARFPVIDMHNHLGRWLTGDGNWAVPDVGATVAMMDELGIELIVNLDGRWGNELRENLDRYDHRYTDRFVTFCQLDWSYLREDKATDKLIASLQESVQAGARGLKVWKDLGLEVTDSHAKLVLPDDPRLAPVFSAAGDLGLPVLIHTADPLAFFTPLDNRNERLEELLEEPSWWFGGNPSLPQFDELLRSLEALVANTPHTVFIGAHAGCAAEDLGWVRRMLKDHPNFSIDTAGRISELGRTPRATRRLFMDYPDRVLFGSDIYPPDPFVYRKYFRFMETDDECFDYDGGDIPPFGRWQISALDLPDRELRTIYRDNARRVLGLGRT